MAVDRPLSDVKPRPQSMRDLDRKSTLNNHKKSNQENQYMLAIRSAQLNARKVRIERWARKGRSISINSSASAAAIGGLANQKRSESTFIQTGKLLDVQLIQLAEQRQKTIETMNFEQKLFANKQALHLKDNQAILRTLSYVRKCCKYANDDDDFNDPSIFLNENSNRVKNRSRSPSVERRTPTPPTKKSRSKSQTQTSASLAASYLQKQGDHSSTNTLVHVETQGPTLSQHTQGAIENEKQNTQKRHVQFRLNSSIQRRRSSQNNYLMPRTITSANGIKPPQENDQRESNSAPVFITHNGEGTNSPELLHSNILIKINDNQTGTHSRRLSSKYSIKDFRLHPERFLSANNRYLPLLKRNAMENETRELLSKQQQKVPQNENYLRVRNQQTSRLSDNSYSGSDLTYDEDIKSFLSDDVTEVVFANKMARPEGWQDSENKTKRKISRRSSSAIVKPVAEKKKPKISKHNLNEDLIDEDYERLKAIKILRDREMSHLQELTKSKQIEDFLEPLSVTKHDDEEPTAETPQYIRQFQAKLKGGESNVLQSHGNVKPSTLSTTTTTTTTNNTAVDRQIIHIDDKPEYISSSKIASAPNRRLSDILNTIDSLRCTDEEKYSRRKVDIEKNRAKLGILLF
ncbi:unnamed protein product [Didymodactylos carnosus]|uniref:Uncharacterized protein n=1 Tax=Didymodactylos carnosus TaxID=1234261 RepID=A0A814L570_9BILA|nr:unnamed protein product [Didymodactylos carnosus]CAF3829432.1 unnamed protein product [Didymodactylos carnosus]